MAIEMYDEPQQVLASTWVYPGSYLRYERIEEVSGAPQMFEILLSKTEFISTDTLSTYRVYHIGRFVEIEQENTAAENWSVNTAGVGSVVSVENDWGTTYYLKIAEDIWIESRNDGEVVFDADILLWENMESTTFDWVEWTSREDDGWGGFKTASGKDWKKEYCED